MAGQGLTKKCFVTNSKEGLLPDINLKFSVLPQVGGILW